MSYSNMGCSTMSSRSRGTGGLGVGCDLKGTVCDVLPLHLHLT